MEEQFRELYNLLTVPDDSTIQTASEQLFELYDNPESIFPLLNLMNQNEEPGLRTAATIGLKTTLNKCWEQIHCSEHLQGLKDNMLELLSTEQDYTIRNIILDAMLPIFSSEIEDWPQLLQFIESISDKTDESSIELFLSILTLILRYLSADFIASLFENLLNKAKEALSTQSDPVILAGSHLLGAIFNLITTDQEIISSVVTDMLDSFYNLLRVNPSIAGSVLEDLCSIFIYHDNIFETIQPIFEQYYSIISDDEIPIESRCICTQLLYTLIKKYPIEAKSVSSQIIATTLELASLIANDDCFDDQLDILYAVRPIEQLSRQMPPMDFFYAFWENVQTDTPNRILAASAAVNSFIEHIPEVISINFSEIFDFAIGCIQNPNHFVQESGFSNILQLIPRYSSLFSDLLSKYMESTIPILQNSDHEPLVCVALSSIAELLYRIEIPDSFIEPLLENFAPLISKVSPPNQYLVINAISALIYSAGESIKGQQVANDLINILQQAASHDPSQHPLIAATGIEGLSYLISVSPSETSSVHQFTLEKIHEFLQFEDAALFSTIMISLRILASSIEASEFVDNVNPEILFGSIIKVLEIDLETIGDDTAVYSSIVESKKTSLLLISKLSQTKQGMVLPFTPNIAHLVINHFDLTINEYHALKAALKASISIAQILSSIENQELFKEFIGKLIDILVENFQSRNQETVSLSFYGFCKLVSLDLQLDEPIIQQVTQSAFMAMKFSLSCQQDDESEEPTIGFELNDEVFSYLAILAQKQPLIFGKIFPLEEFFNFTQKNFEKWKKGELNVEKVSILIECIGVLCELFDVAPDLFPSLFKIALHQIFFESLKICVAFEFPPHPIAAVRCYIEKANAVKEEEIEIINDLAESIFSSDFAGQTYYLNTVSSVISLLFSVVRIVQSNRDEGKETPDFDFEKFAAKMLELLPVNICTSEAENIVVSLVWCSERIQGFSQSFCNELLRILSVILGMKSKKLTKLKISNEAIGQLVNLLNGIRQSLQDADALISEWLDKFSLTRFQERISSE